MFIGRRVELQWLNSDYGENVSRFVVIYGRRRVGKSSLIQRFCEGKRAFIFSGGREKKALQIKRFLAEFAQFINDPIVALVSASTWDEALKVFNARRGNEKLILVLDEFQWMCENAVELISDIQRNWDTVWKEDRRLFLILCGSSVSFMAGEVLSEKSPLFGRRTREIFLDPFSAKEGALFFSERSEREKTEALMLLGGIPTYLLLLKKSRSLWKNINDLAFTKGGLLINEVNFILNEQLKETGNYFRLLRILADLPMNIADLAREMRISAGQTLFYLHRLELLGFIKKYIPITKDINSKSVRYKLVDEYLRFYFYYVEPNRTRALNNTNDYLFERITGSTLDTFYGLAFELFCEKNIIAVLKKLDVFDTVQKIGTYWHKKTASTPGVQIDLVIECSDNTTFLVECKWSKDKIGVGTVEELARKERLYPNPRKDTIKKVIIASSSVTKEVKRDKTVSVITLKDFFD